MIISCFAWQSQKRKILLLLEEFSLFLYLLKVFPVVPLMETSNPHIDQIPSPVIG